MGTHKANLPTNHLGVNDGTLEMMTRHPALLADFSAIVRARRLLLLLLQGDLPASLLVVGYTQSIPSGQVFHPSTVVYRHDETKDEWAQYATITTPHPMPFYARNAFINEKGVLVLIGKTEGLGISIDPLGKSLDIYDSHDHPDTEASLAWRRTQHLETCSVLRELKKGTNAYPPYTP